MFCLFVLFFAVNIWFCLFIHRKSLFFVKNILDIYRCAALYAFNCVFDRHS